MKTMAVVGGLKGFKPWAERVAQQVEKHNDFPCIVIDDDLAKPFAGLIKMPAWIKCYIWDLVPLDIERIVWFDADVIPLKSLREFPRVPFCACRNDLPPGRLEKQFPILQWYDDYFNSGFFVATRDTIPAFQLLKAFMCHIPRQVWPMYEQSWLNLAIVATLKEYHVLPDVYNWSFKRHKELVPDDVITLHFPGLGYVERGKLMAKAWALYVKD